MPTDVIDETDRPDPPIETRLELRHPGVPVTLGELAALKGEALEVIEARVLIIQTLRRAAIRATSPADWLLFKSPEEQGGQVVGYLQDCGADRVRDLWGIEVFDITTPEKVTGNDPAIFHYIISGSGRCKLTRQVLERVEGGRSSTDDFCKDKKGLDLDLAVRKAARANLDGNITRELSGMKSVPIDDIKAAWEGTPKKIEDCRRGRGFGTQNERLGAVRVGVPDVEPPTCGVCGTVAKYRPANDKGPAFYGCPNYQKHADKKWSIKADAWVKQQTAAAPATPAAPPANGAPPSAGEVFGKKGPVPVTTTELPE